MTPSTDQFNGIRSNQGTRTSIVARYVSDNDDEEHWQGGVACLSLDISAGGLDILFPNIEYPLVSTQSVIKLLHQK